MATTWPTAGEMMTASPVTVVHDAPVSNALGLMRSHGIHELPVLRRKKLVGMITFDSIARRTNLPLSTKVLHLMVLPPIVTEKTSYRELAEQLLAAGLRAAPVVGRRGELVGIVSRTDMVRSIPDLPPLAERPVEEVQSPISLVLKETEPLSTVLGHLRQIEEHPIPVVDKKGHLVGAVGVADLGRVLWRPIAPGHKDRTKGSKSVEVDVGTIMHSPAVTVPSTASVGEAAKRMRSEKVSSAFVVEGEKPVGIVAQNDLLSLAVGLPQGGGGTGPEDVYVQVHGLRGSGDPELLTEIDRLIAKGLRQVRHHVRPTILSLSVNPHSTHRTSDATVHARMQTDRGIFYATQTSWNFFASVAAVMEELASQTSRVGKTPRDRHRAPPRGFAEDEAADPALEAKIRAATGELND